MLTPGETLTDDQQMEADVCVVGAGPTGITAAMELAKQGISVLLLESGDGERDAKIPRDLDRGTLSENSRYYPLDQIRNRAVGGTATAWDAHVPPYNRGARYIPFDEVDFEHRPLIPNSGWPWTREEFNGFYAIAQDYAEIGPFDYDLRRWSGATKPLTLNDELLRSGVFQFGSAHVYYDKHRKTLSEADNVTLCTSTTVTELVLDDAGGAIRQLRARTRGGATLQVQAGAFILASGALETLRLLLSSNQQDSRGIGNRHDQLGRYFIDHPLVNAGSVTPRSSARELFSKMGFYDWRNVKGTLVGGHLKLSASVARSEEVLGVGTMLISRAASTPLEGVRALRGGLKELRNKQFPSRHTLAKLPRLASDAVEMLRRRKARQLGFEVPINRGGWSRISNGSHLLGMFEAVWATEQAPLPDNRVTLTSSRDALGQPRLHVDWRFSDIDKKCLMNTQEVFFEAFRSSDVARFEPRRIDGELDMRAPTMHHPMGGARMSEDQETGVVTRECRVHDLENLFLAGGAVFPTGSFANPTLTMMATGVLAAQSALRLVQR